ncbi:TolC family outer membrane protein [Pasteurellaceae bacterium LIM206]|nr:TolC family outer membrane protein [Pasteurellaceae bacterium LIM206]
MLNRTIIFILCWLFPIFGQAETLLELYRLAHRNDPVLQKSSFEFYRVAEAKNEVKGALLPQLNATAQYGSNRYVDHGGTIATQQNSFSQNRTWSIGLQLSQSIFNKSQWLKLSAQEKATVQAQLSHLNAEQNLRYRLASVYINTLKNQEKLNIVKAEKKALENNLNVIKQRVNVGALSVTDLHEAQAQYDRIVAEEILAVNEVNNDREALFEIINSYPKSLLKLDGNKLKLCAVNPFNTYYETVRKKNLTLMYHQVSVELAKENIAIAQADHLPTINLTGSLNRNNSRRPADYLAYGTTDRTLDRVFIGIEMHIPIYSGGQIHSRTKQQQFSYQSAQAELESAQREIKKNLNMVVNSLTAIKSSIKAYEQSVISADSAYHAVNAEYEIGRKTTVDLLNSLRVKYQSQSDLSNARYDYLLLKLQLDLLMGELNDDKLRELSGLLILN